LAQATTILARLRPGALALKALWGILRRWPCIPLVILAALMVCGIFAPWLAPRDPTLTSLQNRNAPPMWYKEGSSEYVLGADPLGRDILSRIIHGARVSLLVGAVSLSSGLLVGTALGLIAGYFGRNVDEGIMRLVDISLAVPYILIALVLIIVFGQSFAVLLGILAFSTWSVFTRQIRAEALVLKEMDYVAQAKVASASTLHILYRHILPGVVNTVIVVATFRIGALIMFEAILSFLGAGIPPPTPAWGSMVNDGRAYLSTAWWVAFFPGVAIFLTVTALNFLGDWLRDRFDPRLRQV